MGRAEQRHRRPRPARLHTPPQHDLVQSAILLGFSFGMALAGAQEAADDRQWVWMGGFLFGAAVMVALYCWVAVTWVKLIIR